MTDQSAEIARLTAALYLARSALQPFPGSYENVMSCVYETETDADRSKIMRGALKFDDFLAASNALAQITPRGAK